MPQSCRELEFPVNIILFNSFGAIMSGESIGEGNFVSLFEDKLS